MEHGGHSSAEKEIAVPHPDPDAGTLAATPSGRIRGFAASQGVRTFLGLPYASAPIGSLRFAPPRPVAPWQGERPATRHGAASLQPVDLMVATVPETAPLFLPPGIATDEDCLHLDVWAPADAQNAPVLVWFHGGGWVTGTGSASWTVGERLAADHGLVVVAVNYRLGLLGQLDLAATGDPAGVGGTNLAILDQIAALRWVRESISAFGGDPSSVTIAGESAGAFSAIALTAAPAANGLFHRVVAQSGYAGLLRSPEEAADLTRSALDALGIPLGPGAVTRLRALPAAAFVEAADTLGLRALSPVVDGEVIARDSLEELRSGAQAGLSLLVGSNRDEFRSFRQLPIGDTDGVASREDVEALLSTAPHPERAATLPLDGGSLDLLDAIGTDRDWRAPIRRLAREATRGGVSCYVYEFAWPTTALGGRLGAAHQAEIPFVFGTLDAPGVGALLAGAAEDPRALAQSAAMSRAWAAFARGGIPLLPGDVPWPAFHEDLEPVVLFEEGAAVVSTTHRVAETAVWEQA